MRACERLKAVAAGGQDQDRLFVLPDPRAAADHLSAGLALGLHPGAPSLFPSLISPPHALSLDIPPARCFLCAAADRLPAGAEGPPPSPRRGGNNNPKPKP